MLLVLTALMLAVILPLIRVISVLQPPRAPLCCKTPADYGLHYQAVQFTTTDGITLSGWYIPSRNRAAVILTHGWSSNRLSMLGQAAVLAQAGFGVLLYDLRGHGESGDSICTRGWREVNDLQAALTYLQTRADIDPTRMGAYGLSIGGQISLRVAAQSTAIRAVVADGASTLTFGDEPPPDTLRQIIDTPGYWVYYKLIGLLSGTPEPAPLISTLGKIAPRPLLLISAGEGIEQKLIRRYAQAAGSTAILFEIPEAGHVEGFAARPQEYSQRLVSFFSTALLAAK